MLNFYWTSSTNESFYHEDLVVFDGFALNFYIF